MKKPSPSRARSRGLPVLINAPWVKSFCVLPIKVPPPISRFTGEEFLKVVMLVASISSKTALSALKPTVFTLAMLSEITESQSLSATRPVKAV